LRIECFDVSNLQGSDIVASMVVMEDGMAKRSDYRRFKIRHQPGQDDFAAMEEALTRRFRRYLAERDEGARAGKRFAYPPNLLLIDGGKGQLGVAVRVLEDLGLEDVCVASLAKRFEEVYLPGEPEPVRIPRDSEALYLLQQIRDEAHRFAITYHRQLRDKKMTKSVLDDVPGLGPVRRARLLREFGSVKKLRELTDDELVAIPWLPEPVARAVHELLHGGVR
jgi:excinuclease ABC subunit C